MRENEKLFDVVIYVCLTPETNGIFQTDNGGRLMIEDHVAGR